jgi:hypothetical protein
MHKTGQPHKEKLPATIRKNLPSRLITNLQKAPSFQTEPARIKV